MRFPQTLKIDVSLTLFDFVGSSLRVSNAFTYQSTPHPCVPSHLLRGGKIIPERERASGVCEPDRNLPDLQCLEKLATHEAGAIACPTCRSSTKTTDVKSLAQNFTLNRMLEILEIQESQRFDCDDCDEGQKAEMRCIDCAKYLCSDCNSFHERRKATKGHSILTIVEFKKNAQELHRPGMFSSRCTRHNGEELKLYCETCETLICRDCTMIDHVRPEHRYIFVHEAGANHRMEIVSALKRTSERAPEAQVLIKSCDSLMAEVNARARDVEAEVRSSFQMHRWQLQQREEELVAAVRSLQEKKEKILTSHRDALDLYLANVKSSCDFTERVLSEGTAAEVLATKVQIKQQLKLLAERELTPKLPVESSLHFYANTQALSEAVESFASVTASSSFPPLCQAVGDGIRSAVVATHSTFKIITFDQQGEKRTAGWSVAILAPIFFSQSPFHTVFSTCRR